MITESVGGDEILRVANNAAGAGAPILRMQTDVVGGVKYNLDNRMGRLEFYGRNSVGNFNEGAYIEANTTHAEAGEFLPCSLSLHVRSVNGNDDLEVLKIRADSVAQINGSLQMSGSITLSNGLGRGTIALVGGTITVPNVSTAANSKIMLTAQIPGGTVGALYVSSRIVGTSFTITSTSATDTSTVAWMVFQTI